MKIKEGIELHNQENIRMLEKKESSKYKFKSKYMGILEADTIKQTEMKGKVGKESLKIRNQTLQLNERNQYSRHLPYKIL